MRLNSQAACRHRTHEGAPAHAINKKQALTRTVLACLLWEKNFYENGEDVATRMHTLAVQNDPAFVANLAVEARSVHNLRHAPLLLAHALDSVPESRKLLHHLLPRIIQRPDELTEFLAICWKDGKRPLSAQSKKGLADAFKLFDEYQLAKYNRKNTIKLRDVLRITHPKPSSEEQAELWSRVIHDTLKTPDTWEVAISAARGEPMKVRSTWRRLLAEKRLGALALLRNLRNMVLADVPTEEIVEALEAANFRRVLPFRFIAAAKVVPALEYHIEAALFRSLSDTKLPGRTCLLVDVSGSMIDPLSSRSDMTRMDAGCGLAIILREICTTVDIFTFSNELVQMAPRHGFALRDAIVGSQPHGGTWLGAAVKEVRDKGYDRLVVITDEQSHDEVPQGKLPKRSYMLNVASYENGVGYGAWTHINGFSEAVVNYIVKSESEF